MCLFICRAPRISIRVQKPRCLLHAHSAGVEIHRSPEDYVNPDGSAPDADVLASAPASSGGDASAPSTALAQLCLSPTSQSVLQDKVFVRDLVINAILGVNPWERIDRQDIRLNLTVFSGPERQRQAAASFPGGGASARAAKARDSVSRPHNYRTIVRSITDYVEASSYKTVESLATSIARVAILQNNVERIRVQVEKPSAIMFAKSAGVEIERDRAFFRAEAEAHEAAQKLSSAIEPISLDSASAPAANGARYTAEDGWHSAAIALGANLGDRIGNIQRAIKLLNESPDCKVVDTSLLYETPPMYVADQPYFLNGACRVVTRLAPHDLLQLTQSIENAIGRDKSNVPEKGPRTVDLDILFYDRLEMKDAPRLIIPHPLLQEREFVLRPLADILPGFEHPAASRTCSQLLSILQNSPDYDGNHGIRKVTFIPPPRRSSAEAGAQPANAWVWGEQTHVMGILNATPDSFSDGGDHLAADAALKAALAMVQQGADILDIGGMSTAPNAVEITAEEEIARVVPLIRGMRDAGIVVPISIDTFRSEVAEAALAAGANIINDVSGGERDTRILETAARWGVPYICMHMRGDSKSMTKLATYKDDDVLQGVKVELETRVERALRAGVPRWNIIADPGIGFAKDQRGNVGLLRELRRLTAAPNASGPATGQSNAASRVASALNSPRLLPHPDQHQGGDLSAPHASLAGLPLLVGPSRKRFLGTITGKSEPKERVYATAAACTAAVAGGADILRVHDVPEMVDVVKTADAIFREAQEKRE